MNEVIKKLVLIIIVVMIIYIALSIVIIRITEFNNIKKNKVIITYINKKSDTLILNNGACKIKDNHIELKISQNLIKFIPINLVSEIKTFKLKEK